MKKLHFDKKFWMDFCLIAGLLCIAAVCYFAFNTHQEAGAYVLVRINGEEVARYSMEENGVYELNGGTNTLVIEDGAARLSKADCPDKLCVNQGKIRYTGQCITCLPNKLTVTVYGADGAVDLIS